MICGSFPIIISGGPAAKGLSIAITVSGKLKPSCPGMHILGALAVITFGLPAGNTFDRKGITLGLLTALPFISLTAIISGGAILSWGTS